MDTPHPGRYGGFKCTRCGTCCRIPGFVFLKSDEPDRIAAYLNLAPEEFIAEYADVAPDRKGLVLKCKTDGSCIMLRDDNLCLIQSAKPTQCRGFPYTWRNPDSNAICPAMQRLEA